MPRKSKADALLEDLPAEVRAALQRMQSPAAKLYAVRYARHRLLDEPNPGYGDMPWQYGKVVRRRLDPVIDDLLFPVT